MSLTYPLIQPYLLSDPPKTAKQIVDILSTEVCTAYPVELDQLNHDMSIRDMFIRRRVITEDGQKWKGTVDNMLTAIENLADTDETVLLKTVGDKFFSHITNPRNALLDLSIEQWAVPFNILKLQFQNKPGMPTEEDFLHIVGLGGGYKFAGVTEDDVQALIDTESDRVKAESLQQIIQDAMDLEKTDRDTKVSPIDTRYNNAVGWLSSYSVVGKTEAEVQTFVDDIANSEDGNGSNEVPQSEVV